MRGGGVLIQLKCLGSSNAQLLCFSHVEIGGAEELLFSETEEFLIRNIFNYLVSGNLIEALHITSSAHAAATLSALHTCLGIEGGNYDT